MESYPKFHNEVGVPIVRIGCRKITHTSTSIWAMPVRSSAPIALRYSVSIRWAHTKLIRQIVLSVTWTEKDALYSLDPSAPVSDCLSNSISSHMDGSHERDQKGS